MYGYFSVDKKNMKNLWHLISPGYREKGQLQKGSEHVIEEVYKAEVKDEIEPCISVCT